MAKFITKRLLYSIMILFFVMFRNNHLTVGSKEADKLILDAKRRNMDSLRKVISTLILKGKTVEVMEVDKDGHLIYQYPAPGR